MKKNKIVLVLGAALMLGGCGNATANISHGSDVIGTIGSTSITDGDIYGSLKSSSGYSYALTMIREQIFAREIEVTDEMRQQAQDEYDQYAEQYEAQDTGMTAEEYVIYLGYESVDDYINKVYLPNYEQQALNAKYMDDDNANFLEEYEPVKAQIIQTSDQDTASQALEALNNGDDFADVAEEYNDSTTYDGSEQIVTTQSGLPTAVMTKLNDAEDGTLKIKTVSLQAKNRFSLSASGTVTGITEPGRKGNLKYSLKIQNTRFLNSLTGESVNIPYGTSAQGNVSFVRDRYSTNSTLRALKGRVNINGSYNTGNESYTAKIKSQQFPLGTILKIDSLHNLTAQFNIKGRGTDVFSKSTTLHAEAEIEKFGISGYDLSNVNLQADLKRGKGDLTFTSENDFLNGEGTITAQLNKKDVAATTRLNINKLDMRQFTGKADTLFIATNISAKVNSNNTMTAYRIIADFNDTKIIAKNNTYPTKDLHLSFGSRKDTLYAALAAGDLDMFLVADGNIEKVGGQLSKLADCFTQQAENKAINQNELRKLLPNTELYINAGTDNPISNMLRYSSGYKFDRLRFRLATDTIKGINGSGHLCAFNIGSMLLDTIDIKIFQDTTGMKINGAVHNVSKKNPYIFKAMLNGYINNDAAGAELIYIDKENKEGVNFGVKASFVDSGVKVHLYPETLVIAYRNFKVNRNNYITLKKNKNILADLDLLADDGTGINLHSSVKDSINDITLKANHINLKELTSTIPYLPAISGFLSSDIHVINKSQEITAAYEVNVKKLGYEDVPIGDLGMDGTYIPFERKGSHGIDAFITRDGNEIAEINGTYFGIEDSLAAKLSLLDFPIEMLNGFTGEMTGFPSRSSRGVNPPAYPLQTCK